MAFRAIATRLGRGRSGLQPLRTFGASRAMLAGIAFSVISAPASAASNNVRITGLSDLAFGAMSFGTDSSRSEDVCVYANTSLNNYQITATGSGTGQSFVLASGGNSLAYEVQWSASAGQTSGTSLNPGVPLTGQHSVATQQTCNAGPAASASLTVVIRASAVAAAKAGSYSGTLSLLVTPE